MRVERSDSSLKCRVFRGMPHGFRIDDMKTPKPHTSIEQSPRETIQLSRPEVEALLKLLQRLQKLLSSKMSDGQIAVATMQLQVTVGPWERVGEVTSMQDVNWQF